MILRSEGARVVHPVNDDEARRYLWEFCSGSVAPEEFEAALYADGSVLARLLEDHQIFSYSLREKTTPYIELMDVHIAANPDRARSIVLGYLNDTHALEKVDAQLIEHVERTLGVGLPKSYLDVVTKMAASDFSDHAIVVTGAVPPLLESFVENGRHSIDEIWGLSYDPGDCRSILQTIEFRKEWGLPIGLVPFDGDGHYWTALDYRGGAEEPTIVLIESETFASHVLAKTFGEFVSRLELVVGEGDEG